jgi:SAM-dependent methyltransferase
MMFKKRPDQYFIAGKAGLEAAERALVAVGADTPKTILDLPSGFGRVLRYLQARWPGSDITACELQPDAVEFCAKTFGVAAFVSKEPLWDVDLGGPYDLIWSGSLFTHFAEDHWTPMLAHLGRALSPHGHLMFTSQGEPSLAFLSGSDEYPVLNRLLPANYGLTRDRADALVSDVRVSGFGFAHYANADDSPYGCSISLPSWVTDRVRDAGLSVVFHETGGWGGHQDVWAVTRGD